MYTELSMPELFFVCVGAVIRLTCSGSAVSPAPFANLKIINFLLCALLDFALLYESAWQRQLSGGGAVLHSGEGSLHHDKEDVWRCSDHEEKYREGQAVAQR